MPTQCSPDLFEFAPVESRAVVASFDGGRITTDAGARLLGATDHVTGLTRRFAACFKDSRDANYGEHSVQTQCFWCNEPVSLGQPDGVVAVAERYPCAYCAAPCITNHRF
jgi:hypothetical protein